MKYLCLLYLDESRGAAAQSGAEPRPGAAQHRASTALVAGLEPSSAGVLLRRRDGMFSVTSGPNGETVEQLGGFVLIEADDLDDAIAVAARFPAARVGAVEIRPVRDIERRAARRRGMSSRGSS
jgi:hypothetical protein